MKEQQQTRLQADSADLLSIGDAEASLMISSLPPLVENKPCKDSIETNINLIGEQQQDENCLLSGLSGSESNKSSVTAATTTKTTIASGSTSSTNSKSSVDVDVDTSSKDLSDTTDDNEEEEEEEEEVVVAIVNNNDDETTPLFVPTSAVVAQDEPQISKTTKTTTAEEIRFRLESVMAAAANKNDPPLVNFKPSSLRDRDIKAVDEFLRIQNWSSSDAKCWNIAVKFLMARKFDVDRAIKLYNEHDHLRKREGLDYININDEDFIRDLESGKFTILPFSKNYPVCALFTVRLHNGCSSQQSELNTLKTLIYQLDAALENPDAQRNGINFIYDMNNCKRSNYDLTLSQKILTLVRGSYPARLNKLYVVSAPFWFKCVVKVLSILMREKIRERVLFVSIEELKNQVPPEILPDYLGGKAKLNHEAWLVECHKLVTNKASTCSFYYHSLSSSSTNNLTNKTSDRSNHQNHHNHHNHQSHTMTSTGKSNAPVAPVAAAASTNIVTLNSVSSSSSSTSSKSGGDEFNSNRKRQSTSDLDADPDETKKAIKKQLSSMNEANSLNGQYIMEKLEPLPFQNYFESIQNVDPDDTSNFSIDQLLQHIIEQGAAGLSEEFKIIRSQPVMSTYDIFKLRDNAYKNRYRDVICLDESRVQLDTEITTNLSSKTQQQQQNNDYIHANFVDGYKQKNAYISTQGPLDETTEDFWRMIWQQTVLVIAMTTKCFEQRKLKCAQYWPLEKGERMQVGSENGFEIINLEVTDLDDYRVSRLEVRHLRTNKKRVISHCQFMSWPDHGVPKSAAQILDFIRLVRENQAERLDEIRSTNQNAWQGHPLGPPIVVHCSAGIGRTGTFCAIEISINRLRDCGHVHILDTVNKIRAQRAQSVQMRDQYVFCYLAVIEYAQREKLLSTEHAKLDLVQLFESLF